VRTLGYCTTLNSRMRTLKKNEEKWTKKGPQPNRESPLRNLIRNEKLKFNSSEIPEIKIEDEWNENGKKTNHRTLWTDYVKTQNGGGNSV
jgi:hypothetical protein